ncbi:MAG: tetratricopeptide repeat protein [Acidobacteria bacterium]|nr:tetratricopeptide repeat protein [Acidobacteriota bacterium]
MIRPFLSALPLVALLAAAPCAAQMSPAEAVIATAQRALQTNPDHPQRLNDLALGYARRARETSDVSYYDKAHEALDRSLAAEPDNYGALRLRVWTLLGQHRFAEALERGKHLNKLYPDDVLVYGFLADAETELGRYEEAIENVQWMLDLRPGNVPALTRAAYLRELHGWIDGATDFMQKAYERTSPGEKEDRAWIQTHLAHLELSRGNLDKAEAHLKLAMELFPDYHYALAELGKLRLAQDRVEEAVSAFEKRYEMAPHPENLLDVARALDRAGRKREAEVAYAKFEKAARAEMNNGDNCNRDLADYYVDFAEKPEQALQVTAAEMTRRQDIFTRATHAWALHASGRSAEAWKQMETAIAVGVRDSKMLYRAGIIARAVGNEPAAERLFRESLEANPTSPVAAETRRALHHKKG